LLERLKPWSVTLYCTDDYAPYDTLLPVGRHYIGKDETVAIERVNSRLIFPRSGGHLSKLGMIRAEVMDGEYSTGIHG
jgi:hypothetical protein